MKPITIIMMRFGAINWSTCTSIQVLLSIGRYTKSFVIHRGMVDSVSADFPFT